MRPRAPSQEQLVLRALTAHTADEGWLSTQGVAAKVGGRPRASIDRTLGALLALIRVRHGESDYRIEHRGEPGETQEWRAVRSD